MINRAVASLKQIIEQKYIGMPVAILPDIQNRCININIGVKVMVKITSAGVNVILSDDKFNDVYTANIKAFNDVLLAMEASTEAVKPSAIEQVKQYAKEIKMAETPSDIKMPIEQVRPKTVEEKEKAIEQSKKEEFDSIVIDRVKMSKPISQQYASQQYTPPSTMVSVNDQTIKAIVAELTPVIEKAVDAGIKSHLSKLTTNQESIFRMVKSLSEDFYINKISNMISDKFMNKTKSQGELKSFNSKTITQFRIDALLNSIRDKSAVIKVDDDSCVDTWGYVTIAEFKGDGKRNGDVVLTNGVKTDIDALFEKITSGAYEKLDKATVTHVNYIISNIKNNSDKVKAINVRTKEIVDISSLDLENTAPLKEDIKNRVLIFKVDQTKEAKKRGNAKGVKPGESKSDKIEIK